MPDHHKRLPRLFAIYALVLLALSLSAACSDQAEPSVQEPTTPVQEPETEPVQEPQPTPVKEPEPEPLVGHIAYQEDDQLWLTQADLSGEPRRLMSCEPQDRLICLLPQVHWSPDGSRYFYGMMGDDGYRLVIADLAGQQQHHDLPQLPSRDPVWSPAGDEIIYFVVDGDRPWGDHTDPQLSPLDYGFTEVVWHLQLADAGGWSEPMKLADLETPGFGCGGGGTSVSDDLYDAQGGFALGYQAARQMAWSGEAVIIYPLTCDYWQGYGRFDVRNAQALAAYEGPLRGLTLDTSGSRWYAVTGHIRDEDPANNRLVTGTVDSPSYEVIETAVPVEMVFVGPQSGRLYYTARERYAHQDISDQIQWDKSVQPYFNFYRSQLWTIRPDGSDERLLWESDAHSFSRLTETLEGDILFVFIENDVDLYETIAAGAPEEEWAAHLPHTHIMRLALDGVEPAIWLEDAHNLSAWYPPGPVAP